MSTRLVRSTLTSAALLSAVLAVSSAQQPGFTRTELQRADLSTQGKEAVTVVAELPPGVGSGRHTHPGEEIGFVLEGTIVLEVEGRPAMTYKAGQAFIIPDGRIHSATNKGSGGAKVLANYIIAKGQPVATPVP